MLVREVAESTFAQIREHLPSVPERRMQLVAEDSPAAGLHSLAERENPTLIAVGSSHRSPIGRILPGGTAERLLSGAPAPVAVAPAGYAETAHQLRVIGCGFDGSAESRAALEWAASLSRAASARLRVLAVHDPVLSATVAVGGGLAAASLNDTLRREREEQLSQAASSLDEDLDVDAALLDGSGVEMLARESGGLDLLVLGSRGYGPLRAVLLGSVSTALVRAAESPLVVVPRGAQPRYRDDRRL